MLIKGTEHSKKWSIGAESWSGVLECSGVKLWSGKVGFFAILSDKAMPCFRTYQEHKHFHSAGVGVNSYQIDLYFWGNHNGTKLKLGTCQSGFVLNCMISKTKKGPFTYYSV